MQENKQPYETPELSVLDLSVTAEGGDLADDGDTGAFAS